MTVHPDTEVKLVVGNEELTTWQSYEIESDLLQPSDAFSLAAPNHNADLADVVGPGDLAKVVVDGELQMVGYVDDVAYLSDDEGARVEITGRDLFQFLVDCSALPSTHKKKTLLQLAQELTSDWISTWSATLNTEQIKRTKIEPGETILDVLQRIAKKENLLIWATADGQGRIGKPNYSQAPLYNLYHYAPSNKRSAYNNVIRSRVVRSWRDRYSEITVHGTTGNTAANYANSSRARAVAIDIDVEPARALIMTDGDVKSLSKAQALADLEVARRKFDAVGLEYTVKGHYGGKPNGYGDTVLSLWQIDTLVSVEDEFSAVDGDYYVIKRRFKGDDSGRFTELELRQKGVWLA